MADSRTECPFSPCVCVRGMGTQHHARRPSRALGSSRLSVQRGSRASVQAGDRRHSMVGGQVESESLCLSVRRSFLALCLSVSVGQVVERGRPGQCRQW